MHSMVSIFQQQKTTQKTDFQKALAGRLAAGPSMGLAEPGRGPAMTKSAFCSGSGALRRRGLVERAPRPSALGPALLDSGSRRAFSKGLVDRERHPLRLCPPGGV